MVVKLFVAVACLGFAGTSSLWAEGLTLVDKEKIQEEREHWKQIRDRNRTLEKDNAELTNRVAQLEADHNALEDKLDDLQDLVKELAHKTPRKWTARSGSSVVGILKEDNGIEVVFRKRGGGEARIVRDRLSDEDKAFLDRIATALDNSDGGIASPEETTEEPVAIKEW